MQIIQGDTFELALAAQVDGVTTDLTGWTITASVFVPFSHSYPLTFAWIDQTVGTYSLSADTSLWPIGQMMIGVVYHTDSPQQLTSNYLPVFVSQGIPQ